MLRVDGGSDYSVRFTVRNDAAQLDYVDYGGRMMVGLAARISGQRYNTVAAIARDGR
jgi:hypothetical protein